VELKQGLTKDRAANAAFDELPKKEYKEWIGTANKFETTSARVVKALGLLSSGAKRLR